MLPLFAVRTNLRAITLPTLILLGVTSMVPAHAGFTGADEFLGTNPDTNSWLINGNASVQGIQMTQDNGLSLLSSNTVLDGSVSWFRSTNAPTDQDWSAVIAVTNTSVASLTNQSAGIGLTARNPESPEANGLSIGLDLSLSSRNLEWTSVHDHGISVVEFADPSSVNTGFVLLTYTASNSLLRAAYDAVATTNSPTHQWILLGEVSLPELSMSRTNASNNTFLIGIYGSAENLSITSSGIVSADHFLITNQASQVMIPNSSPTPTPTPNPSPTANPNPSPNFTKPTTPITYATGKTFPLIARSISKGKIVFFSSDTDVISVSGAIATVKGAGTATLTATVAATANYASSSATNTVTVNPASAKLSFTQPATPVTYASGRTFILSAKSNSGGAIAYSSSDPNVISVSGAVATLKGAGKVTLTAAVSATANYAPSSATRTVTVKPATSK